MHLNFCSNDVEDKILAIIVTSVVQFSHVFGQTLFLDQGSLWSNCPIIAFEVFV